ncbi:hypothetical protein F5882DRAFT_399548 [Hyaloscypha sp. PMI_1271]|nr:hypothetical protein F5882DRAFT_399548 [Hyaloscypha sp. PMI_1271]
MAPQLRSATAGRGRPPGLTRAPLSRIAKSKPIAPQPRVFAFRPRRRQPSYVAFDDDYLDELNPEFIHGDEMEPEGKVVQQDMEVLAVGMIGTDDAIGEMIEGAEQEHAGLDAGDRARVRPEEEDFENRPTGNQKLEKDGSMEVHGEASEMEETGLAQDCMVVRAKDLKLHEEGHLEVGLVAPRQQIVTRRDYNNLMGKHMKVCVENEMLRAAPSKPQVKEYTLIRFSCSVM